MLRASALLYSVVFSIVILIITLFIIASLYDSQVSTIKLKRIERANDNMESAIAVLLNTDNVNGPTIDLFKDGKDIAYVNTYKWGLCDVKSIICAVGKDTLRKAFILGYAPDRGYAINITASDRVLNIAGRTTIKGNAFIPNGTFKRAYIEGRGSLSSSPVDGQIKPSPYLSVIGMDKLKQDLNIFLTTVQEDVMHESNDIRTASFTDRAQVLSSTAAIKLESEQLKGKYIIKSATKISVASNASLEDVILIAPEIEIEDGFTGIVQGFASNKLNVGKHVALKYPSALCLLPATATDSTCILSFGDDSKMAGTIVAFLGKDLTNKSMIIMGKDSKLYGQIFCEGYVQLQGSVYGNVQAGSFYLKTPSAIYDNTLLDANVSCSDVNSNYYSYFDSKQKGKQVIKWLY